MSVALNVVLVISVVLLRKPAPGPVAIDSQAPCAAIKPEVQTSGSAPLRNEVAPFSWSQVEADDFPTYIKNLKKIGCPEQTIQDIVAAEIAALYEGKRRELTALKGQSKSGDSMGAATRSAEIDEKLTALTGEQSAMLNELLPGRKQSSETGDLRVVSAQVTPPPSLPITSQAAMSARSGVNSTANSESAAGVAQTSASVSSQTGNSGATSAASRYATSGYSAPAATPYVTPTPPTYQGSLASSNNALPARRSLFTLEEQQYRAKWGWQAFYYEPVPTPTTGR